MWYVELPLSPTKKDTITELQPMGFLGMALNGVPVFGAKEGLGGNALDPNGEIEDARFWYGHSSAINEDHYHNQQMGHETVSEDTLLGYALDGFKIYGYTDQELDECNGRMVDGEYRYHIRAFDEINTNAEYCGETPSGVKTGVNNWNYILVSVCLFVCVCVVK